MTEPLSDVELVKLDEAIYRDYEFTHHAGADLTGGPAITAHLLYTIRDLGPRLLATIKAERKRADDFKGQVDTAIVRYAHEHRTVERLRSELSRMQENVSHALQGSTSCEDLCEEVRRLRSIVDRGTMPDRNTLEEDRDRSYEIIHKQGQVIDRFREALEDIERMTGGYPRWRANAALNNRCPWWKFPSAGRYSLLKEHCKLKLHHEGDHEFVPADELPVDL